jgi:predicted site-specific integrase-resolvase
MEKERYTLVEVAERFGVDRITLWRWGEHGCPMPIARRRTRGRPLSFTEADIKRIEKWRDGVDEG